MRARQRSEYGAGPATKVSLALLQNWLDSSADIDGVAKAYTSGGRLPECCRNELCTAVHGSANRNGRLTPVSKVNQPVASEQLNYGITIDYEQRTTSEP